MPYKQNPRSPILKALVGKQGNLPQHLQDAIKAAPESPAKKSGPGDKKTNIKKATINAARQMLKDSTSINNPNLSDAEVIKAAKTKGVYGEARSQAKRAAAKGSTNYDYESPAKVKDPVTGKKVKGYAKNVNKATKSRDRAERKKTRKSLKATAKSDGKVTRVERQGVRKSMRDLRTTQRNERVAEVQKQRTKDVVAKETQRIRNKANKLSDAVQVGYSKAKADKKWAKAKKVKDRRVSRAKRVEARTLRNTGK